MISKEELIEWIFANGMKPNGTLVPRTEKRINSNIEIRDAILFYTQNIESDSICERMKYIGRGLTEQHKCICGVKIDLSKLFCSTKCVANSKDIKDKRRLTNLEKYGTENPACSQIVKDKISVANKEKSTEALEVRKNTNLVRYGVESLLQREDKLDKAKQTTTDRYGVDNIFKSSEFIANQKIRKAQQHPDVVKERYYRMKKDRFKTNFRNGLYRYSDTEVPLFTEDDWQLDVTERGYHCTVCDKDYFRYSINVTRCTHCFPIDFSRGELELHKFISSICDSKIDQTNRKLIPPMELDLYIHDKKLAIEYNGLLYHSYGKSDTWSAIDNADRENRTYHLDKTNRCMDRGVQLLHIFENEWLDPDKQEIWKSIIRSKMGLSERIYARKCKIVELDYETKSKFLKNNHLQGDVVSTHNLGLEYNGQLVSVLTIGKSRFNKKYEWEILRYSNLSNHSVYSGFTRLLTYFRKHNSGSVITYADKRYSNGDLYRSNGFVELKDSAPNYWYCKYRGTKLYSRMKFQKHKLKDLLEVYDDSLTEAQNMFSNDWRRIWDCGNKVFVLE